MHVDIAQGEIGVLESRQEDVALDPCGVRIFSGGVRFPSPVEDPVEVEIDGEVECRLSLQRDIEVAERLEVVGGRGEHGDVKDDRIFVEVVGEGVDGEIRSSAHGTRHAPFVPDGW